MTNANIICNWILKDGDGQEQTVAVVGDDGMSHNVLHADADLSDLQDPTIMGDLHESSHDGKICKLCELIGY